MRNDVDVDVDVEELSFDSVSDDGSEESRREFEETVSATAENKNKDAASRYMNELKQSTLLSKGQEIQISQQIEFFKNTSLAFSLLLPPVLSSFGERYNRTDNISVYSSKPNPDTKDSVPVGAELSEVAIEQAVQDLISAAKLFSSKATSKCIDNLDVFFRSINPDLIASTSAGVEVKERLKKGQTSSIRAPYDFYTIRYADEQSFQRLSTEGQRYASSFLALAKYNVDNDYIRALVKSAKAYENRLRAIKQRYLATEGLLNVKRNVLVEHYKKCVDSFELHRLAGGKEIERKLLLIDHDIEHLMGEVSLPPTVAERIWLKVSFFNKNTEAAINKMCQSNLLLVISVARKYRSPFVEFMDLVQEGNIGLIRAVEKFDYRMGNKFSTYGIWWIRQAVTRALSDQSQQIRVPAHMQELIKKIDRFTKEYVSKNEGQPTEAQVAAHIGVDLEKIKLAIGAKRDPISLNVTPSTNSSPTGGDEAGASLLALIEYDDDSGLGGCPSVHFQNEERKSELRKLLSSLPERDAKILMMRYGFDVHFEHTLEEAGKQFSVTRERIRQLEKKACEKLSEHTRGESLVDYL